MESVSEDLPVFHTYIPLNQKLGIDEAIAKLTYYFNSNRENVEKAFMYLHNFTEGTIGFRETLNSGYPCIIMEGFDMQGNRVRSSLMDLYTGQPQMRCS